MEILLFWNLYFTKWEIIKCEKSKSIFYEMKNNQVWKIKIYILRNELFLGVTFNNLHFTKSVINFQNLYFTKWAVDFQNLYFTKWPIIYKLYSWIVDYFFARRPLFLFGADSSDSPLFVLLTWPALLLRHLQVIIPKMAP